MCIHFIYIPGGSDSKEPACKAVNPSSIPGLGRSAGEGTGYSLQYSWSPPVAQKVKNPPAMWETWFQSLGWEDPLEKGMAIHSSILAWRIPMDRGAWWAYSPWGCKELDTTEQLSTQSMQFEAWLSERRHISEGLRIIREFQGIIRSVFRHLCPLIC